MFNTKNNQVDIIHEKNKEITCVCFSLNGDLMCIGDENGELEILDLNFNKKIYQAND